MPRPRIAILSSLDTSSRRPFSGTPYYMSKALEEHCGSVVHLGPVRSRFEALGEMRNRFSRRLLGREIAFDHSRLLAHDYSRIFSRRLREEGRIDVIFAPAASTQIALLRTDIPIVYASDATFQLMRDYHQSFTAISDGYAATGNDIERRAILQASAVTYPSQWAANSAQHDYEADPNKIFVIPWGPNVDHVPASNRIDPEKKLERCSLVFIGVNWERKGGAIAYQAADILRRRGLEVTLTVCGCIPPKEFRAEWFRVIPFLNKQIPAERDELSRLLLEASFFVLPTRNDCFPMVLAESSAHGTPAVVTDTGGISESVVDGQTGFLMQMEAGPEDYANVIHSIWSDKVRYRRLVLCSRERFDKTLNWDQWGLAMRDVIDGVTRVRETQS